jgi:hypothetical protein
MDAFSILWFLEPNAPELMGWIYGAIGINDVHLEKCSEVNDVAKSIMDVMSHHTGVHLSNTLSLQLVN